MSADVAVEQCKKKRYILDWIVIITKKFEFLGYAGLCLPSLAFWAFMALDDFLKQKKAFADKN